MEKDRTKKVALVMLPILIFLILVSVSYALTITASVTVIADATPPTITIQSPESKTYLIFNTFYDIDRIPLNFTINEPTSWIRYSLDNRPNVTVTGNTTLTVFRGSHNIIVYAKDKSGNEGASEKRYFSVIVKSTCIRPGLCWL